MNQILNKLLEFIIKHPLRSGIVALMIILCVPFIIDLLFPNNSDRAIFTTHFHPSHILAYIGALMPIVPASILGYIVWKQNKQLHDKNVDLENKGIGLQEDMKTLQQEANALNARMQETNNKLIEQNNKIQKDAKTQGEQMQKLNIELQWHTAKIATDNMAYNTFTYLNIEKMEVTPEEAKKPNHLKFYTLESLIPWPLDVRGAYFGYPNGNVPIEIQAELPPFPLGNSKDFQEEIIAEKVFIGYQKENSKSYPSIDPSIGIWGNGTTHAELVLWQGDFPIPRYYPYYMPFGLRFLAKSSRDFFVRKVEISRLDLNLMHNKNMYRFESRIYEPLVIQTLALDDIEAVKDGYNHIFGMTIHLCHAHDSLLREVPFSNMYLLLDVTYENLFGVKTRCQQQVAVRGDNFQEHYVKLTLIKDVGFYESEELVSNV